MMEDTGMLADSSKPQYVALDLDKIELTLHDFQNLSIACELGVCYPVLKAMLNSKDLHRHDTDKPSFRWHSPTGCARRRPQKSRIIFELLIVFNHLILSRHIFPL
jgi:hypothetical protein